MQQQETEEDGIIATAECEHDVSNTNETLQEVEDTGRKDSGSQGADTYIPGSSLTQSFQPHTCTQQPSPSLTDHHRNENEDVGEGKSSDEMNLDLLDPMGGCMEEDEVKKEEEKLDNPGNDDVIKAMNMHEYSTPINAHSVDSPSSPAVVPVIDPPPSSPSPSSQLSHSENPPSDDKLNSTSPSHSPNTKSSSSFLTEIVPSSPQRNLYNDGTIDDNEEKTDIQKVTGRGGGEVCGGGDFRDIGEGVEETVVKGGSSGELFVTNHTMHTNKVELDILTPH